MLKTAAANPSGFFSSFFLLPSRLPMNAASMLLCQLLPQTDDCACQLSLNPDRLLNFKDTNLFLGTPTEKGRQRETEGETVTGRHRQLTEKLTG